MVDMRHFSDKLDPSKKAEKQEDQLVLVPQWWKAEAEKDLAAAVWGQLAVLIQADQERIQKYGEYTRLYGGPRRAYSNSMQMKTVGQTPAQRKERMGYNLVQSCIDTKTSKIAKEKPKPSFLTSKGNSKVQRKAKKLDDFCAGVFYENKAYRRMPVAFRDSEIWGDGIIQVLPYHGRVRWERVLPHQLFADFLECQEGPEYAKTLHRVKQIDRTTLAGLYPEKAEIIAALDAVSEKLSGAEKSVSDMVTIVESWRLPSAPDAEDGRHAITVQGQFALLDEEYGKEFFPFAFMRNSPPLHGFWSQGAAERLDPIQTELNRCLITVQRSLYLGGTFKVLLHAGSKVVKSHIDNSVGAIISWTGEHPPEYITPPMVQPEIYQQIESLIQKGYRQEGISELSAMSAKPAGLNSGKALRETVDIETDRFQLQGQAYEDLALQLALLSVSVARDIYKDGEDLSVKVPGRRFISTVDWKDVDMDDDEYVMQIFPVSKLPSDPEGRLETIQELMQAGIIDPQAGRRLLDYPDLDAEENLSNAQLDYLHQILDAVVEDGKYTQPEPDDNLQAALKLAVEYLAVGKRDNLEEERKDMLRNFIAKASQLAAPPQPMPGPAGQPMAVPAAPPTSNLLPNVPAGQPAA